MSSWAKNALASLAALAVGALILLGITRLTERQQTTEEINRLRDALYRARVSAGRCQGSLQTSEASLLVLGLTIDSLKNRVDSFEAMERGGVPAGRYNEYLEIFDSYNDSVEVWDAREGRLRSAETTCRATIEEHNALTDSLQTILAEAGIEPTG